MTHNINYDIVLSRKSLNSEEDQMRTKGRAFLNEVVMVAVYLLVAWGFVTATYMTLVTLGIHEEVEGLSILRTSWEYARSLFYFVLHLLNSLT